MSKYQVKYSPDKKRYGVGREKEISDGFSVFEIYGQGYIFADRYTAQRMADDLNDDIPEEQRANGGRK